MFPSIITMKIKSLILSYLILSDYADISAANSVNVPLSEQWFIKFFTVTLHVAFISVNLINIEAISSSVFAAKRKRSQEREKVKRQSALHRFIATGSCTAQEKFAYIITCGPGVLQRALLIAETQSGGGEQPTQEELGKALPHN